MYAAQHGIAYEIIPGISSSYSVPALAGIPLTSRGISESFWVITGTTKSHKLSQDLLLAAQSTATVVILMGLHKLAEIVQIYAHQNKLNESISIIQNGSRADQKIVTGKISNIEALAHVSEIGSPAVIVIGQVASFPDLSYEKIQELVRQNTDVNDLQ